MTKSELIEALADRGSMPKNKAEQAVNCIFDSLTDAILREERIELRGFGAFSVKRYEPYLGRNPKTGKAVQVKAKKAVAFRVGKNLRERVNSM